MFSRSDQGNVYAWIFSANCCAFGTARAPRWRDAGEREEVITREHLCVTDHGVTEPDVDVEPREVSPSHPRHDREHAASPRRHLDLAPRRLDDELEEIAKISAGRRLKLLVNLVQASAKPRRLHWVADGQIDIPRRPRLGSEAELHRVPALEQPGRIVTIKEPREQPLDGHLQPKPLNLHATLLRDVAETRFERLAERRGVGVTLGHSRLPRLPARPIATLREKV